MNITREERGYQSLSIAALQKYSQQTHKSLLGLQVGAGKTYTIMEWLRLHVIPESKKIVWVGVHQAPLPGQWIDTAIAAGFGGFGCRIGAIVSEKTAKRFSDRAKEFAKYCADARFVVVMIPKLRGFLNKIPDSQLPDILILDEAHLTDASRQKVINRLEVRCRAVKPDFHTVLVTATPGFPASAKVPLDRLVDRQYWIIPTSPEELQANNWWKKVEPIDPSPEYGIKAERLFAGISIDDDKEEDTRQAAVMMALIDDQIDEWAALQTKPNQPTMWACCSKAHAKAVRDRLIERNYTAQAVYSAGNDEDGNQIYEEIESEVAIDFMNDRSIQHTCTVFRLQAGADIRPKCEEFWIVLSRMFGFVGNLEQFMGRGTRPCEFAPGQWSVLKILDCGRNFGQHGLPFTIDWLTYSPKKSFVDAAQVRCSNPACNYFHKTTPTPIHPTDRKLKPNTSMAAFSDGTPFDAHAPIVCHGCGSNVTFLHSQLLVYAKWQKDLRKAIAKGEIPPRPPRSIVKNGVGIRIGSTDYPEILTSAVMCEVGIWGESKPSIALAPGKPKDRSADWILKGELVCENRLLMQTKEIRTSLLPKTTFFKELATKSMGGIKPGMAIPGIDELTLDQSLACAVTIAYLNNKPPSDAFTCFPPDAVLTQLHEGKPWQVRKKLFESAAFKAIDKIAISEQSTREVCHWLAAMARAVEPFKSEWLPRLKYEFLLEAIEYASKGIAQEKLDFEAISW